MYSDLFLCTSINEERNADNNDIKEADPDTVERIKVSVYFVIATQII